jgi:hypothetical protein
MNYTPKQLQIIQLIKSFTLEKGYSPTLKEIAGKIGVSSVTVFEHLTALERKGAIKRRRHEARSVELIESTPVICKHYKGGLYTLIGEGLHAETDEKIVVYRSQQDGTIWVRSMDEFYGKVVVDGVTVDRFEVTG